MTDQPPSPEVEERGTPDGADEGSERRTDLADRRTGLANERTLLAWWRTGLTALAVAIGVGRLLPELTPDSNRLPFVAIGVAFAIYGIALFLFGTRRSRERDENLLGGPSGSGDPALVALTVAAILLGLASAVLILAQ